MKTITVNRIGTHIFWILVVLAISSFSYSKTFSQCFSGKKIYGSRINECRGLSSLEGLASTYSTDYPATVRLSRADDIINPKNEVNDEYRGVSLVGGSWTSADILVLINAFPNVEKFGCIFCNLRDLSFLSNWPKLKEIDIDQLPTTHGRDTIMRFGVNGGVPFSFEGLDYSQIKSIRVNQS